MCNEENKHVSISILNTLFTKFSKNVKISHDFQKKSGFTYIK